MILEDSIDQIKEIDGVYAVEAERRRLNVFSTDVPSDFINPFIRVVHVGEHAEVYGAEVLDGETVMATLGTKTAMVSNTEDIVRHVEELAQGEGWAIVA